MFCNGVCNWVRNGGLISLTYLIGFVIRRDNGSNNSIFLSCQMGLSDGAFFMIKHTPLPNGNHPISSPVCPMGVADTLEQYLLMFFISSSVQKNVEKKMLCIICRTQFSLMDSSSFIKALFVEFRKDRMSHVFV